MDATNAFNSVNRGSCPIGQPPYGTPEFYAQVAVIKPGLGRCVPGFLKLLSCGLRCVCLCVCPRAIKNHLREMKPE